MKFNFLKAFAFGLVLAAGVASCTSDPCKDKDCGTNGTCVGVADVASCDCDAGYAQDAEGKCNVCATGFEGYPTCVASNAKFLGNYTVISDCLQGSTYSQTIAAAVDGSETSPNKVTIDNLGNTTGLNVQATCDGNTISVVPGTYTDGAGDSWTISGTGTRTEGVGGAVVLNLTVTYNLSGTTFLCQEQWSKN